MRFSTATGLVTRLLDRREERDLERFHTQLERLHLIVLDELGYVAFAKAGAELLLEVVGRTYGRTSLIVTTHLPFESWTEVMGSERLTGALLDRLTHRVHVLEASGESYRLREARSRCRKQASSTAGKAQTQGGLTPALRRVIHATGASFYGRHPPRFSTGVCGSTAYPARGRGSKP